MGGAHRGNLPVVRIEVQLRDGPWARFDTELPAQPEALPWRLALTLVVLLASVLALSLVAVRWVVRPLQQLTAAAQSLGEDLNLSLIHISSGSGRSQARRPAGALGTPPPASRHARLAG